MKQVTGKDLARAITQKGSQFSRSKGSHHVYLKDGHRERIVIPMHRAKPLKLGLLKSIMKIAGLAEKDL